MKKISLIVVLSLAAVIIVRAQKKVSELMLVYDYAISASNGAKQNAPVTATNTIYIKGNLSRTEMVSSLFSSVIIYDAKAGSAVILKEVSGQKLLIRMKPENIEEKNSHFSGLVFINTAETKTIAGYKCIRATATTKDGFTLTVYYTKDLIPENKDYDAQFKNLDGLPLEYEITNGKVTIKNTLSAINLNPVPASKFDIPKSGYREMTFDESKKLKVGG